MTGFTCGARVNIQCRFIKNHDTTDNFYRNKIMAIHPDAGRPVAKENLIDVAELISCYYQSTPDVSNPDEQVAFEPLVIAALP